MKKISQVVLSILSLCIAQGLFAQDMKADLEKVRQQYEAMSSFHIQMTSAIYTKKDLEEPVESKVTNIRKKGNDVICEMDQLKLLMNEHFMITHLTDQSVLVCNKREGTDKMKDIVPDISSALQDFEEVSFKGLTKGLKCYVLKNENSATPVIEVYINESTTLLDRMVYHYSEDLPDTPSKVDIQIEHLAVNPTYSSQLFSEKQYVQIDENTVSLQQKYKDYTLVLGDGLEYPEERH